MKFKYYLRGLGVGLIITTLILTVSNAIRGADGNTETQTEEQRQTVGSVIAYTTAADKNNTESSSADENGTQNITGESRSESSSEAQSREQTTQAQGETQEGATVTVRNDGVVVVVFKDVIYGTQAADILYEAGVISDRDDFVAYLTDSGYASRIRDGEYELTPGDSYENISRIITKS